jgi:hypothetical protein
MFVHFSLQLPVSAALFQTTEDSWLVYDVLHNLTFLQRVNALQFVPLLSRHCTISVLPLTREKIRNEGKVKALSVLN